VLLFVLLAVAPVGAAASGQVLQCSSAEVPGPHSSLPSASENSVRLAEAILEDWATDLLPATTGDRAVLDSVALSLLKRLQDTLAGDLAPALLTIMVRPLSSSPFRVTSLQYGAAYFYVRAGLPDTHLETILLSQRYELDNRVAVFRAVGSRDFPKHRVSGPRLLFTCTLAREFLTASREELNRLVPWFAEVLGVLEVEREVGSRQAAALLEDPTIRSAVERLRALGPVQPPG